MITVSSNIPAHIQRAPLLTSHGGYRIAKDLLDAAHFRALRDEAREAARTAVESNVPAYDKELWRGGNPARKFLSAHAGAAQEAFYQSPGMMDFLSGLLACQVQPSGMRGTFTYYSRPGDFIGVHRDVDTCDVAVITCLYDTPSPKQNAGKLVFYPGRLEDDNRTIRQSPAKGAELYRLEPGETVILLGGLVAHAVLPVVAGQARIVSVLCYTAVEAGG
jgi:hypothetical protein